MRAREPVTIFGDPVEFERARDGARRHTFARTASLLAASPERLELFASGVLISLGDHVILVTAAHAIDEIEAAGAEVAIGLGTTESIPTILKDYALVTTESESGYRFDDSRDLALLILSPRDAGEIARRGELVQASEIDMHYSPAEGDVIVGHGFPVERAPAQVRDGLPYVGSESTFFATVPLLSLPGKLLRKIGKAAPPFAVWYDRYPPIQAGCTGKAPHPKGFSGSGLWLLGRMDLQKGRWSPVPPRLVGIVTEWSGQHMLATRCANVIQALLACIPEMRPGIIRAFPDEFGGPRENGGI